jgi:hypothetical protein
VGYCAETGHKIVQFLLASRIGKGLCSELVRKWADVPFTALLRKEMFQIVVQVRH